MNEPSSPSEAAQPSGLFASYLQPLVGFVMLFADVIAVAVGAIALYAFWARYSWAADLCCQFRVQLLMFLLPATIIYWIWRKGTIARWVLLCTVANLIPLLPYLLPAAHANANPDTPVTRIMMLNLLVGNKHHDEVVGYVKQQDPDVFIAIEAESDWTAGLKPIHSNYPHRHLIDDRGASSIAVYSKISFNSLEVRRSTKDRVPSLNLHVTIDQQPLQILAIHPYVPLSRETARMRNAQLNEVAGWMDPDRSRILLGDFNCTPWSPHFADVLKTADVTPAGYGSGLRPTWYRRARAYGPLRQTWVFALKLDHILLSRDLGVIKYQIGPCLGSDHRPVIVDFARKSATPSP